jgi:hypothetical protein
MPRTTVRFLFAAAVWLMASLTFTAPARAQSPGDAAPTAPRPLPTPKVRFDVAASLGPFRLNTTGLRYARGHGTIVAKGASYAEDVYGPEFPHTWAMLVGGGYYWNAHSKTEVEVGWRTRTDQYDTDPPCPLIGNSIRCDLRIGPIAFLTHNYEMLRGSVAQVYQFRRSARFQPYIGAGVSVQVEREFDARTGQTPIRTPASPGPTDGPGSRRTFTRPFVRAGFQKYTSNHVFVVTELRIGKPELWTFKLGLGVGF